MNLQFYILSLRYVLHDTINLMSRKHALLLIGLENYLAPPHLIEHCVIVISPMPVIASPVSSYTSKRIIL